jgi:peptide/nickel transport system substrate-binding protein
MCKRVVVLLKVLSVLVLMALLLMGTVAPSSAAAPAKPPAPAAAPDETPRRGGTIVVAIEADPPTLYPGFTVDSNTVAVGSKIFNGLTLSDSSFIPRPGAALAESWDISKDGLTYTMHLRKGVKWHDGQPFTCKDVQFSYTQVLPKYYPGGADNYGMVKSVECPDDNTAVFNLSAPFAPLLTAMKPDGGSVLPRHLYQGTDIPKNPANLKPVGTGPFMFQEWVRGDHITVVRNPNYFLKGRPFLDRIIFKIIPDVNTAIAAFEAGEVDYIPDYRLPKSQVERLAKVPGVQIGYDLDAPKPVKLFFNLKDSKPCADINVRRAISHAIDRKAICDLTMYGFGVPIYNPFPPQYKWAYNKDAQEPGFDLNKANNLLDDAGYKRGADGMRFALTLSYQSNYPRVDRPNEVLREQLKKVGIDLKLKPIERNVMVEEVYHKYNFELHDHLYSTYGDPALGISRAYVCRDIDPKRQFNNVSRYCNQKVDQLFVRGDTAPTLEERAKAYFELQKILVDELPAIDMFMPSSTELSRTKFRGLFLTAFAGDVAWDWVWSAEGQPLAAGSYEPIVWLKK